jgi:hypothetical protein
LQSSKTLQTLEVDTEKSETQPKKISKCQLYGKGQLAKLLSYHPTTDIRRHMKEGKVVDGFHHSIFPSITSDIMSWPSFLAFLIDNNERDGKYS